MGNCINLMFSSPQEKIRVLIYNGGGQEFTASTRVKKIMSGTYRGYKLVHYAQPCSQLPPESKLKPGELYFLMPELPQPCSPPASDKMRGNHRCGAQTVKIVVSKQQLGLLLRSARKCQSIGSSVIIGNVGVRGKWRKWQPSLAVIPEFHNF